MATKKPVRYFIAKDRSYRGREHAHQYQIIYTNSHTMMIVYTKLPAFLTIQNLEKALRQKQKIKIIKILYDTLNQPLTKTRKKQLFFEFN